MAASMSGRSILPSLLLALALASVAAASPPVLMPVAWGPGWQSYVMNVTIARDAPDCFERTVVLVNGMHTPTLIFQQGTRVNITVNNMIPADFPSVYGGISIHWHGFPMYGEASWYDGVAYGDQCPITPGTSFTYSFAVETAPGTYFWHDHSFAWKGDGLQGPLIVRPRDGVPEPWSYAAEHILHISDWWHTESNVLAMRLNRAFDPAQQTNNTGYWVWVGLPQALLFNGKGYFNDCMLYPGTGNGPNATTCNPNVLTVGSGRSAQQPWASDVNPGCTHEQIVVQSNSTYRIRLIGGTELMYTTVCFEGHNVTVITADAFPVESWNTSCVDINAGQRYDVLLTANQPARNYWITVQGQYRPGTVNGYAVLSYMPPAGSAPVAPALPTTPAPQPGTVAAWTIQQVNQIHAHPQLLVPHPVNASTPSPWSAWQNAARGEATLRVPTRQPTRRILVAISQPLFNKTGMLRWALNNLAMPTTPTCDAYRASYQRNSHWLNQFSNNPLGSNNSAMGVPSGTSSMITAYEYGRAPAPSWPTTGLQFVSISDGDIVDVILQNQAANANNGDYRNNTDGRTRTAQEQHPIHLHGHHFWVLGTGLGTYDPFNATLNSTLNMVNPAVRDSVTVPPNGWAVIRFVANNPGAWPLHCHILWHHFMGQQLHFLESRARWTPQPRGFPTCPRTCIFNFNPYARDWVQQRWGNTGYPLPN